MRTSIFGLSALVLIACGPTMNATPVESAADTGQAAQELSSGVRPQSPRRIKDEPMQPRDPQCGACAAYVLSTRTLYLFIDQRESMPNISMTLYSTRGVPLATYKVAPKPDGSAKALYAVDQGLVKDVGWASVRWLDQGATQELRAGVQTTWSGWAVLGQQ
ncbi:hypothetical protein WME79_27180 [Sorangium sp. So ce726]|uniref:hypothetical protein n=1 Tax=Sorangium sp. So ce726 TaxID=3133319 RepID=UPI003F5EFFA6